MNKGILNDYIDACELVKDTEKDIARLGRRKQTIVTGNVKGSMSDFPYAETHFKVSGVAYTYSDDRQLRMEEKLLEERKADAERLKIEVESWMNAIPMRMQRIIRYKYFEKLSWEQAAERMGKKATGESLRKEVERFLEKN